MIEQLSLFAPDVRTVEGFVRASYTVYKRAVDRGWITEDFLTHESNRFKGYEGGSAPTDFTGFDFYDYSPKGVRLTNFKTGEEIKFGKDQIIRAIKEGGYCE